MERLIEAAAADPGVLAIKQTLYRTSDTSSIVDALIDAAEAGKQVVVVVELKARFDERANIIWARKLEEAGCHVVYGIVGLKTHCKMALVVREEPDGSLRRYCHIGTGNYHPTTARLYEDFGLLTAEPTVGEDATDLFNHLTGYSRKSAYRRFLVAPAALRRGPAGADRAAGGPAGQRRAGPDPAQVQLDRRRGGHRRAVPGLDGGGAGGPVGARHLRGCGPGYRACRRPSGSAACSAGSWSTPGSTRSATARTTTARCGSAPPT